MNNFKSTATGFFGGDAFKALVLAALFASVAGLGYAAGRFSRAADAAPAPIVIEKCAR